MARVFLGGGELTNSGSSQLGPAPHSGSLRRNGASLIHESGLRILGRGKSRAAALWRFVVRQEMNDRAESARGGFQFVDFQGKLRELYSFVAQNYVDVLHKTLQRETPKEPA